MEEETKIEKEKEIKPTPPETEPGLLKRVFKPIQLDVPSKIESPVQGPGGIKALWEIPWNSMTKKLFDRGRRPHVGNRYVFKCTAVKGNSTFFTLERL